MLDQALGQPLRLQQVLGFRVPFVDRDEAVDQEGVVGAVGHQARSALAVRRQQAPFAADLPQQEVRRPFRGFAVGMLGQDHRGFRQCGDHETVPTRQHLFVQFWQRPLMAQLLECGAGRSQPRFDLLRGEVVQLGEDLRGSRDMQHVLGTARNVRVPGMHPVPDFGDAEMRNRQARVEILQRPFHLLEGPDVELAFLAFAVRVLA